MTTDKPFALRLKRVYLMLKRVFETSLLEDLGIQRATVIENLREVLEEFFIYRSDVAFEMEMPYPTPVHSFEVIINDANNPPHIVDSGWFVVDIAVKFHTVDSITKADKLTKVQFTFRGNPEELLNEHNHLMVHEMVVIIDGDNA